jgi:DNA-directed RNA polymerase subunit M/transcription elongation factor TFIIS
MAIRQLKSCPRCTGDMFIQRGTDGWWGECPACGYRRDISQLVTVNTVGQIKINEPAETALTT